MVTHGKTSTVFRMALAALLSFGASVAWCVPVSANSSQVGVVVEAPPAPPTTPAPPPATQAPRPAPAPAPAVTTAPTTIPVTTPTFDGGAEVGAAEPAPAAKVDPQLEFATPVPPPSPTNPVQVAKSAAESTKRLLGSLVGKEDLAEVAEEVLPENVAALVVPAIRAGSTFAFPMGLAVAVIVFLMIQRRIDSGDPKLTAAPIGHEDDVVIFR